MYKLSVLILIAAAVAVKTTTISPDPDCTDKKVCDLIRCAKETSCAKDQTLLNFGTCNCCGVCVNSNNTSQTIDCSKGCDNVPCVLVGCVGKEIPNQTGPCNCCPGCA
ncbi:uncharacterized protein LOC109609582 [Aethina tumida]|uniref:uncharacterized protein LOC109609582 n=1 Tax=Aethina tumida TaxID=116153 RepID=UPI00096B5272|nr:uncharacterized protein LOC109609582 [Aethina tumida]